MADTAAPSPTASVAPSIRGDPRVGSSAGPGGLVVPEGMVVVWDDTQKLFVLKDRNEVRPKTWRTRLRDAAWKFWAGGPILGSMPQT